MVIRAWKILRGASVASRAMVIFAVFAAIDGSTRNTTLNNKRTAGRGLAMNSPCMPVYRQKGEYQNQSNFKELCPSPSGRPSAVHFGASVSFPTGQPELRLQ